MSVDLKKRSAAGGKEMGGCLFLIALGFFFVLRPDAWSQEIEKKTVEKKIEAASAKVGCPEEAIVANTRPQFEKGRIYKYETIRTADKTPAPAVKRGASGEIILRGESVPLRQTIKIGGEAMFNRENCLSIEREGVIESPLASMPGLSAQDIEGVADQSKSYITPEGKILSCESKMTMTVGQSTSVSTNTNTDFSASSDLHYFYGYWMLALSPDFSWECLQEAPEGQVLKKLEVTGMEKMNGKDCFVVDRTIRTESGRTETTTYWIDKEKRIAVQVKKGNYLIKLVS